MGLRIRALQIRIETSAGRYGTEFRFQDGLCVVRAPNTSGKSTCLQAIIYALGLEGMLSASHEVPLPQAVTGTLADGALEYPVLESAVTLEIANSTGQHMTIERTIKGSRDRRLVRVWAGQALTNPTSALHSEDFYVRAPRAAVGPRGFHTQLAAFMGWDLPMVPKYDGGDAPLYVECLFPLLFVEQKKGWSVIPARFPQYLGIRDMGRRAVEFLLDLDAYRISSERQSLRDQMSAIRSSWRSLRSQADGIADSVNAVAQGIPSEPTSMWPPAVMPDLEVSLDDQWVGFGRVMLTQRERIATLDVDNLPKMAEIVEQTESELRAIQERVAQREFALQRTFDDLQAEERQSQSISERLGALAEDLRQYQDTKRLQSFGSQQGLILGEGNCPTCHQSIADSLLPQDTLQQVMTVEENIDFIKAQIAVFQTMERDNVRIVGAKRSQVAGLREEVSELRERVRSVRTSLISDARLPSIAALQERVNLESRIKQGERAQQEFENLLIRLGETASSWRDAESKLAALPPGDLTETDENKLKTLERSFRNQLRTYGLSSTSPDTLAVSRENYKPIHEGFDIEFNNSASDLIRTLWAYYTALLETSAAFGGNHPGLLILDEPRQQSTARQSFGSFLRHLADPALASQQIIVATSEEDGVLKGLLEGQTYQYIDFDGKILRRFAGSPQ